MDSEDLTTDQAKAVRQALQGSLSYLHRLQRRMEKAGFLTDDPLFLRVSIVFKWRRETRREVEVFNRAIKNRKNLIDQSHRDFLIGDGLMTGYPDQ